MNGILIIDKPSGMTSHDVVARIRRITGVKKVGHGGTLDPLATGVLPILVGSATKIADKLLLGDKEYLATVKFGETTDTDDSKGDVIERSDVPKDIKEQLEKIIPKFTGVIEQMPPIYSAIKKNGCPAYKIARKGGKVELEVRKIEIKELVLEKFDHPFATFRIKCSKGTYIRALARDIGRSAGCGAHITELRRTASGPCKIEHALTLDKLSTLQEISRVLVTADF